MWNLSLSAGKSRWYQANETQGDWIHWFREWLFESENCKSILPLPVSGTGLQTKLAGSKMADISQVPFWRVCRLKRRRSPQAQKKGQAASFYSRTSSFNKGLIIGQKNLQDSVILPSGVTNHSAGFPSSCPHMELAIVIYHGKWIIKNRPRHWKLNMLVHQSSNTYAIKVNTYLPLQIWLFDDYFD